MRPRARPGWCIAGGAGPAPGAPRPVAEVYEEQADLMMFAPGDVVKVEITAVNGAGESAPSEPVTVTLSLAAVA